MDFRDRIAKLLTDSSAYQAGVSNERQRLATLIDIRIDQLRGTLGIRNRGEICAELLRIRQQLHP